MEKLTAISFTSGNRAWEYLSRGLSMALHPFLIPVYAVLILVSKDGLMVFTPLRLKLYFISVITLNTLVVPALFIALLRSTGVIRDLSLNNRQERTIPIAVVALCYGISAYMVSDLFFGFMIRKYLIAAFGCAVVALAVTFFWKISLHMVAAGAVTGMLLMFVIAGVNSVFYYLIAALLLTGMLASARLYLAKHTPMQLFAGFMVGVVIASASLLLF